MEDLKQMADEIQKLSTRDKLTMARELLDAPASKINAATKQRLITALLRMAIAEIQ